MSRNVRSCDPANFSRMRSEGFPFIVGVWGWTYVRVVLVVGSSSDTRRIVIFLPLGSPHTMRQNHFLQTMKSAGSMKSKVMKSGASNSQDGRSVLCFCVAGSILWRVNASASFSRGRRSTLQCGLSHFLGMRSTL